MAILYFLRCRLRRGFAGGIALMLILFALSLFTCIYSDNLQKKEQEINTAYEELPVEVVISNLQGNQTDHLHIPGYYSDLFLSERYSYQGELQPIAFSSYLTDLCLKSTLYYQTTTSLSVSNDEKKLVGITDVAAAKELQAIEGIVIDFFEEQDTTAFWRSNKESCIVSKEQLLLLTPDEQGNYFITLTLLPNASTAEGIAKTLPVAGTYSGGSPVIYLPWSTGAAFLTALEGSYTIDSISAIIKDNRKILEFKTLLEKHFSEVDPAANYKQFGNITYAATVFDETLNKTVHNLTQNLRLLQLLQPFLLCVEVAIAFFSCLFFIHTRRRELVTLRFLGVTKKTFFLILLLENLLWQLIGTVAAVLVHHYSSTLSTPILIILEINLSSLLGTMVSGLLITRRMGLYSIKEVE